MAKKSQSPFFAPTHMFDSCLYSLLRKLLNWMN